ncbi:hypothetical protein QAD02_018415 [Eretmocerus hayati]|uniref:Uncharacterized protein n=1 Tax=Eretmocerus hayati TaxID=131215 RepID=A0ACC2PHS1_9HYME|nr:hypothetical protein QAD02_018415 [Eretmocerus hayati]
MANSWWISKANGMPRTKRSFPEQVKVALVLLKDNTPEPSDTLHVLRNRMLERFENVILDFGNIIDLGYNEAVRFSSQLVPIQPLQEPANKIRVVDRSLYDTFVSDRVVISKMKESHSAHVQLLSDTNVRYLECSKKSVQSQGEIDILTRKLNKHQEEFEKGQNEVNMLKSEHAEYKQSYWNVLQMVGNQLKSNQQREAKLEYLSDIDI